MFRDIKWIGATFFTLISIAAVILFKERVIYVDSAYYAFNLFNEGVPVAEHNRYALYLYQFIPWLMMKAQFSVSLILRAYSLCHVLLHVLGFLLLLRINQPRLAALLLIMQIIGYRECFFLSVNETALAISATLVLAGYMDHFERNPFNRFIQIGIYFTCIVIGLLSHPMAMVLIPFVIGYHLVNNRFSKKTLKGLYTLVPLFILAFIIKKIIGKSSGYEDNLFDQLNKTGEILANITNIYSFKFFTGEFKLEAYFFNIYFMPVLAAILSIYLYVKKEKYLSLVYYLISLMGFWLLIIIFFNQGDGNMFMEKNFTPWILLAFYPLKDLLDFKGHKMSAVQAISVYFILLFSAYGIYKVTPMYKKRMYLTDQLITTRSEGKSKLLIQDSLVNHEEWLGIWALPYETLLLSSVKGIPNVTAKIYHNEEQINKELHRSDIFLGADFIPVLPASYLIKNKLFKLKEEPYYCIGMP